jgi:phosphopantothenoylcysteine decarboxylase/phosphopantothenate--cysteine ligase
MAPAMHTEMWRHPATQANVATLRSRGVAVMDPAEGRLTGKDSGPGRLPEPEEIFAEALRLVAAGSKPTVDGGRAPEEGPLAGRRVLVSAGGTREAIDPVRFLGNRSSGKQGVAIARAALRAGASVTLVAAHLEVAPPAGVELVSVESALELHGEMVKRASAADGVIMAAAVADFRPARPQQSKIKKRDSVPDEPIALVRNPDILVDLVRQRDGSAGHQIIVGFAAETGDEGANVLEYGRAKLERKGCELLVVNEVGTDRVFGQDENSVTILAKDGAEPQHVAGSKDEVADAVVLRLARALDAR